MFAAYKIQDHYIFHQDNTQSSTKITVTLGHRQRRRTSVLTKYIGCCYANKATEGAKWDGAHLVRGEPHPLLSMRQLCAPHRAFTALLYGPSRGWVHFCAGGWAQNGVSDAHDASEQTARGPFSWNCPPGSPQPVLIPAPGSTTEPSGSRHSGWQGGCYSSQ